MDQKTKKEFLVKFTVENNQIQTQMKITNVSPQESIGLLEMVKAQIIDKIKTGRKDLFEASSTGDKSEE